MKKARFGLVVLALVVVVLMGCQSQGAAEVAPTTAANAAGQPVAESEEVTPPQGQPGELPQDVLDTNLLALGILELEETAEAVTPEQAGKLLPFWQMVADGGLKGDAETGAVMKQIQAALSESQQAAIAAMDLTAEDQQAWMVEQGVEMPADGDFQPPEDMSEEDRAAMREKMSEMRPEGAGERPEGSGEVQRSEGGGFCGGNVIVSALVELLTTRAGE